MQNVLTYGLGLVLLLAGAGWVTTILRFRTFTEAPGKFPLLIWLYVPVGVMMVQSLLDPPNFLFDQPVDLSPTSANLGQAATVLGYVAIAMALVLAYLRQLPFTRGWVLPAGLLYYGLFILAAPLSTVSVFPRTALTGLGVLLAVWASINQGVTLVWLAREAQRVLYLVLYSSLVLWLVDPERYTTSAVGSGILSDQRLFGLSSHPNLIGFYAGLALLLGLYPLGRLRWWRLHMFIALAVLLLAGSKTAAGAVLIALSLAAFMQLWRIRRAGLRAATVLLLIVVLGGGAVLVGTTFEETVPALDTTFSGRDVVWSKTLAEFADNPLAGYGPALWGSDYRAAQGMLWVGQAHNQGVQALGEAGILGAIGLGVLLIATLAAGIAGARATGGMSIALAVYVIVRMWSEAFLLAGGVGVTNLFALIVWLGVLGLSARHQVTSASTRVSERFAYR